MPRRPRLDWRPPPGREAEAVAAVSKLIDAALDLIALGAPRDRILALVNEAYARARPRRPLSHDAIVAAMLREPRLLEIGPTELARQLAAAFDVRTVTDEAVLQAVKRARREAKARLPERQRMLAAALLATTPRGPGGQK